LLILFWELILVGDKEAGGEDSNDIGIIIVDMNFEESLELSGNGNLANRPATPTNAAIIPKTTM